MDYGGTPYPLIHPVVHTYGSTLRLLEVQDVQDEQLALLSRQVSAGSKATRTSWLVTTINGTRSTRGAWRARSAGGLAIAVAIAVARRGRRIWRWIGNGNRWINRLKQALKLTFLAKPPKVHLIPFP